MSKYNDNQFLREERIWYKCRCDKKWAGDRVPAPELQPSHHFNCRGYNIQQKAIYWMGNTGSKKLESKYNSKLLLLTLKDFNGKQEEFYHMTEIKYKDLKFLKERILDKLNDDISLYNALTKEEQNTLIEVQEKITKALKENEQFL